MCVTCPGVEAILRVPITYKWMHGAPLRVRVIGLMPVSSKGLQRRLAQLQQVQLALDHGDLQVAALELQLPQGLLLVLALVVAGLPL